MSICIMGESETTHKAKPFSSDDATISARARLAALREVRQAETV